LIRRISESDPLLCDCGAEDLCSAPAGPREPALLDLPNVFVMAVEM
jgi:hypothetical protein